MTPYRRLSVMLVLAMAIASSAWGATPPAAAPAGAAADEAADCKKFRSVNPNDSYKQNPDDIHQCIFRGADSPVKWRRDEGRSAGVRVGGSNGGAVGIIQGPERSPYANGADLSVSANAANFALKFPPWAGFPCQLPGGINLCGGGGSSSSAPEGTTDTNPPGYGPVNGGSNSGCAAESDTTGTFGTTLALSAGSVPLVCGGAVPLTSYEMSLTRNADHLAATEYGASYLWLYQQSGSSFSSSPAQPVKLPSFLCTRDAKGTMVKSVTFSGPIAQMIMLSRNTSALNIRMIPLDTQANPTASDYAGPEKYLVIPVAGGVPQVPEDCALEADYYKPITAITADVTIQSAVTPLCEGSGCNAATANAPASSSCDTTTIYPKGTTQTTAGPIDCSNKILIAVLSRPNLLYPPGETPQLVSIQGRTGVLVQSTDGSSIYAPHDATLRFGLSAPALTLPSGGEVTMADGGKLAMSGPAIINPAAGEVTLTNGGELLNASGSAVQSFAAGSRIAPAFARPFTVHLERDIQLPTGYLVPTQPNPYVRLPLDAK